MTTETSDDYPELSGWKILLDALFAHISRSDSFKLKGEHKYHPTTQPIVGVNLLQIKEKWGTLRVYFSVDSLEIPNCDPIWYADYVAKYRSELGGFVKALEMLSGKICMRTGLPGQRRNLKGLWITLSDLEYQKWLDNQKS